MPIPNVAEAISQSVRENALVFLNKAIFELCSHNDMDDDPLEKNVAIISASMIQISFELILMAATIKQDGIRAVLRSKHKSLSDDEIYALFESNELPTINFNEVLTNFQDKHSTFNEWELFLIDRFQTTRNKLMHLSYPLDKSECYDIKYDLINYIVHVLVQLLTSDNDYWPVPLQLQNNLDNAIFKKLISFRTYLDAMETLAHKESADVYTCIFCDNRTYAVSDGICYACNFDFESHCFCHCNLCGKSNSVIYDGLNIGLNNNTIDGLCLNCGERFPVFKCSTCGTIETFDHKHTAGSLNQPICSFCD